MDGRPPRHLPRQARLRGDAGARRRGRRRRGPGTVRHPGAPRHPAALGPAPQARRGARLLGHPERAARGAEGQPPRRPHRGPPARVPRVPRRDPEGLLRRGDHADLGPRHLRGAQVGAAQGRGRAARRAPRGPLRAVPARQGRPAEGLDDPPDGPAGRPRAGADAGQGRADDGPRRAAPPRHGTPPATERWAREIKWDGVRAIAHSEPGRLRFRSRNLHDITPRYPELSKLNRALSHHRAILDGEIVALDPEGKPSFGALQRRMHLASESAVRRLAKDAPVTYMIFDLLWLDGHSLTDLPYEERRARLAELALEDQRWRTPDYVAGHGAQLLAATEEQGLEGIVAKRLDSPYEPGRRSACWVKVKNHESQEVVIGGWMPGEGRRRERIGAVLVGVREDGHLRYAGKVGTGFTEAELDRLGERLVPLERPTSPFDAPEQPTPPRGAVWVEPRYVAEVEFREWTQGNQLRAPSYKGLRDDKPPDEVVREGGATGTVTIREEKDKAVAEVEGREIKVSNLDKVLYPKVGFRKRDVIAYYADIAPVLLPHLEGRPLTLKRYPNGVDDKFFYEKQAPSHRPAWVHTARVPTGSKTIEFVVCDDLPTLVWLANLADLELHTSLSLARAIERPTALAFDLDPGE